MGWKPKHARPWSWFGGQRPAAKVGTIGVVLAAVVGAGLWALSRHGATGQASAVVTIVASHSSPSAPASTPSSSAAATGTVRPVSVDIPAINVHTTLQPLGLDSAGALETPTNLTQAGWYTGGPVPGQNGPAVIAGHVDSFRGPAVFFELKTLKQGDAVTVGLSDGRRVTFHVMLVRDYPKDAFPTADVYGARPDPELRLITCGGAFTAGHYVDNVVVYAALAGT
jgi:LPXTG-site transpeptidase (sortase) family protein